MKKLAGMRLVAALPGFLAFLAPLMSIIAEEEAIIPLSIEVQAILKQAHPDLRMLKT